MSGTKRQFKGGRKRKPKPLAKPAKAPPPFRGGYRR